MFFILVTLGHLGRQVQILGNFSKRKNLLFLVIQIIENQSFSDVILTWFLIQIHKKNQFLGRSGIIKFCFLYVWANMHCIATQRS
jgi:hypothetical protein